MELQVALISEMFFCFKRLMKALIFGVLMKTVPLRSSFQGVKWGSKG